MLKTFKDIQVTIRIQWCYKILSIKKNKLFDLWWKLLGKRLTKQQNKQFWIGSDTWNSTVLVGLFVQVRNECSSRTAQIEPLVLVVRQVWHLKIHWQSLTGIKWYFRFITSMRRINALRNKTYKWPQLMINVH